MTEGNCRVNTTLAVVWALVNNYNPQSFWQSSVSASKLELDEVGT